MTVKTVQKLKKEIEKMLEIQNQVSSKIQKRFSKYDLELVIEKIINVNELTKSYFNLNQLKNDEQIQMFVNCGLKNLASAYKYPSNFLELVINIDKKGINYHFYKSFYSHKAPAQFTINYDGFKDRSFINFYETLLNN